MAKRNFGQVALFHGIASLASGAIFRAGYELTAAVDDFDLGKLGLLRGTVLAVHRQAVVNRAKPTGAGW
ncbi:MAG: hypothetical protein QF920_09635 [Verrucomicrobiota bacterium]|nr:hypothetical protein [Verrucomicrobiota bacterium]